MGAARVYPRSSEGGDTVKRLVEFPLEGGSTITVEVDEQTAGSPVRGLVPIEPQVAVQTFETALE